MANNDKKGGLSRKEKDEILQRVLDKGSYGKDLPFPTRHMLEIKAKHPDIGPLVFNDRGAEEIVE